MAEQLFLREIRDVLAKAEETRRPRVTDYPFHKLEARGFSTFAEAKAASRREKIIRGEIVLPKPRHNPST